MTTARTSELDAMTDAQIARLPAVRRVQHLRALNSGATVGDDQWLVLRILRASSADLVLVVDGADAWDLLYAVDGLEFTELRGLLQTRYYAETALFTALRLVRRCIDGETAEWEQQMVADIVVGAPRPGRPGPPARRALQRHERRRRLPPRAQQARVAARRRGRGSRPRGARVGLRRACVGERRVVVTQACCGRVSAFTKSSSWRVVQHSCSSQNGAYARTTESP